VLKSLSRHLFRPAHLHVKVSHPQHRSLTSQVYFDGGEYLTSDVANAVRDGLIAKLVRREDPNDIAAKGLKKPYFEVHYDFILVRASLAFGGELESEIQISALQPENM
jgi:catechol 1,2-dioxygenase